MPADIAKLTEEAEIAQASYEALLNDYELSSGVERIRLVSRLTSALMRRDETLFALGAALRALGNSGTGGLGSLGNYRAYSGSPKKR